MSLLAVVPGVLSRAYGIDAVEYLSGPATWSPIVNSHHSAPQLSLEYDDAGARETTVESVQVSSPAGTAPTLAVGAQLRIGGASGTVYAVRNIINDSAHGLRRWIADRRVTKDYGPERGSTR